jgi:oxygen-independent coproporphyrinogen-3 oxidase
MSNTETVSPPRSAYFHVPFCRHRCGYCNFSLVANRDYLVDRYLSAIETEVGWADCSDSDSGRRPTDLYELDTLFLGGGTPSHLSPEHLVRLGEIVSSKFFLAGDAEVTAECNPNDLTIEKAESLVALGVNRVSLGVQSLNIGKLKALERTHHPEEVARSVELAKRFFKSVSIDLIFAAPNETLGQWKSDLDDALSLSPDHVSTYELTFEKGTRYWNRLASGELVEADEDLRAEMYQLAIQELGANGFEQYEVSSFAKVDHRCRHNLVYWIGDPYFAFGPGASRFVEGVRETNHQSPTTYIKQVENGETPVVDREHLAPEMAARERLAIGLRVNDGVGRIDFKARTGFDVESVLGSFGEELIANDLVWETESKIGLTAKGLMIADWISGRILSWQ